MYYTIKNHVNPSYLTVGLFRSLEKARNERNRLGSDFTITPILTQKEFENMPRDYKGGTAIIIDEVVVARSVKTLDGKSMWFTKAGPDFESVFLDWLGYDGLTDSVCVSRDVFIQEFSPIGGAHFRLNN